MDEPDDLLSSPFVIAYDQGDFDDKDLLFWWPVWNTRVLEVCWQGVRISSLDDDVRLRRFRFTRCQILYNAVQIHDSYTA